MSHYDANYERCKKLLAVDLPADGHVRSASSQEHAEFDILNKLDLSEAPAQINLKEWVLGASETATGDITTNDLPSSVPH